ncbi:LRR receptor-like serine/threonine-protein kinase ERECTA [Selaginella moellendorffii]|nr:LRR receptor-like serine/threonine-protein kinase ERECTA [Selaginella moellendorffii]|eukprot:XP_002963489.2 LRR receptor-like serine/threonine-protein kinase ERECTA [Selaginella moellendorffii]
MAVAAHLLDSPGRKSRQPGAAQTKILVAFLHMTSILVQQTSALLWLDSLEVRALNDIRSSLRDLPGSNFLASWDFSHDPCSSFKGVVCWSIGGVNHVTMLSLGSGIAGTPGLAGTLSPSLGKLTYLRSLALVPGQVHGCIPDSIAGLKDLQFIGLANNRLSGSLPSSFSELCSVQGLDVSYNALTGSLPEGVAKLPNLNTLTLSHNSMSGALPLFSAPLIHLDLQRNGFTGPIPSLPGTLEYLSLAKNCLTGTIQGMATLQRLAFLDLSFNQFTGGIPPEIFGFRISNLLLQRNQLSGPVQVLTSPSRHATTSFTGIPAMVDLSYNCLTGQAPAGLAFAQKLFLNNNRFSGAVPQEFVDAMVFGDLQVLYLQHNYIANINLASTIPLPTTCTFCIQYNCLSPPQQSSCPFNVGRQASRPMTQCSTFH